jgi:hypothetical protein
MSMSQFFRASRVGIGRARTIMAVLGAGAGLVGCGNILEVEYPGRIPADQINDPALASVLVTSVIGDFECAYNNYFAGSSVQSDEFETANDNGSLASYGERGTNGDADDYVIGPCEANQSDFGMWVPMHTARFQSEDVFKRLSGWTDAQVPNRTAMMATVRAYGAYIYTFMGETFCSVSFDKGPKQDPSASLVIAEQRFTDAIGLAQQAGDADILNMARVGLARTEMDLKKWSEAQAAAAQVPAGYEKFADRGTENDRRWNKIFYFAVTVGAYVVADAYRALAANDARVLVADAHRGGWYPNIELWYTTKHPALDTPIRLSSYREAQLILAEALAQQGQTGQALTVLNTRRAEVGLSPLTASTQQDAINAVIDERKRELSFEGGHRLNDLLRYNIPWKIGTNAYSGRRYGTQTCWPYPTKEANGA